MLQYGTTVLSNNLSLYSLYLYIYTDYEGQAAIIDLCNQELYTPKRSLRISDWRALAHWDHALQEALELKWYEGRSQGEAGPQGPLTLFPAQGSSPIAHCLPSSLIKNRNRYECAVCPITPGCPALSYKTFDLINQRCLAVANAKHLTDIIFARFSSA